MIKKLILLLVGSVFVLSSNAQGGMFENWAVGVNAGLYGVGVQGATSLTPNLKLRAGFDFLTFKYSKAIDFDAPVINSNSMDYEMTGELSDLKLKFPNVKVLVDYYPMENGVFCLTAGFYFGKNKIDANGMINKYDEVKAAVQNEHPQFEFEDVVIQPNTDGSFGASLKMGNAIKPYVGIGLGRTIANSRVGFKFELGMVYQGKYKIESPNIVEGVSKLNDMAADLDLPVSKSLLNWWPMLNFALSYRIK